MVNNIYIKNELLFKKKTWEELDSQFGNYFIHFNQIFLNLNSLHTNYIFLK